MWMQLWTGSSLGDPCSSQWWVNVYQCRVPMFHANVCGQKYLEISLQSLLNFSDESEQLQKSIICIWCKKVYVVLVHDSSVYFG